MKEGCPRCDVNALQEAHKGAWDLLSDDEQQLYLQVAKELDATKGLVQPTSDEGDPDESQPHVIA